MLMIAAFIASLWAAATAGSIFTVVLPLLVGMSPGTMSGGGGAMDERSESIPVDDKRDFS